MSSNYTEKFMELANVVGEFKAENRQLKERVEYLERENMLLLEALKGMSRPAMPIIPADPTVPHNTCKTCGLTYNGPMGYVCPRFDCPTSVTCKGSV